MINNTTSTPNFTSSKIFTNASTLNKYTDAIKPHFEIKGFGGTTPMQKIHEKLKPTQAAFIYNRDGITVLGKTKEADTLIGKLLKSVDSGVQYSDDFEKISKPLDLTI